MTEMTNADKLREAIARIENVAEAVASNPFPLRLTAQVLRDVAASIQEVLKGMEDKHGSD